MLVHKIGSHSNVFENGMVDKNSGLSEYSLIFNEVKDIDCDDYMIIINGPMTEEDVQFFSKNNKKYIFVLSDLACLKPNLDIINKSSIVLQQSYTPISEINVEQIYGYVPELFYVPQNKKHNQIGMCLFGGANTGRQDKFDKYLFENGNVREKMIPICKKYKLNGTVCYDDRMNYESFKQLLSIAKYSLVISRSEYDRLGWVTSRFIEAMANYNLPLIDCNYDRLNKFEYDIKVNSHKDILNWIEYFDNNEDERLEIIEKYRNKFSANRGNFNELIRSII